MNGKRSALTAAALTAAGIALSAGAASAASAAPRISGHQQLQASISAAVADTTDSALGLPGNPIGRQAE